LAEGNIAQRVDLSLVVRIVRSYVAGNPVAADQLADLIDEVYRSLSGLGQETSPPEALVPTVPVRRSVQRDYVVCLECGFHGQAIRRHLSTRHGLTPEQYRARWKLPATYPITAPAYSERRSAMAKELGLGQLGRRSADTPPAPSPPTPRRRGRPRRSP
jgi:predicted transcriptional regulator